METPVTILILAAGLGTRMKSRKAKVLHRAGGLTLIEHVVRTSSALRGPEHVVVVVGHQADQVRAALDGYSVQFVLQSEPRGTGHAVMAAKQAIAARGGLLVVLYGDCPLLSEATLQELIRRQKSSQAAATLISTVLEDPTGYGRVLVDEKGVVRAVVEQKAATPEQLNIQEVNSGIYCFQAGLLWEHLDRIQTGNPAGEYYLTDIVEIFHLARLQVDTFRLENATEVLGINTREELATVDGILRERKVRELMLDGVTVERPETVTVDSGVRIGMDTTVGPFTQILGKTEIGEDCRIGASAIISDSKLGNGVEVGPFTIVSASRVDAGARVGPFARLRLENHVEAGAAVGNFVELKKTRLGAGSKSMHLAYLGDSTIGAGVNIGAGTITCNYDGIQKHQTKIADGAFIGSNATLVAPVEIGEGSYVGAGSVITDAVPPDALAVGRGRQEVKHDWAKQRREKSK